MYDRSNSILDQITFVHGPHDLLAQYFALADKMARDLGVELRVSNDFDRLTALNQQHRDSWPPLTPMLSPRYNRLGTDTAFWIEGVDQLGDTVVTNAGRLYDLGDRSLASELGSLRILYDDPRPFLAAGEAIEVTAPSAKHIWGRVTWAGAMWVRPDYRRLGFTKIIPRLTRAYALTQWNTPIFWAMIEPELDAIGVTRAYGAWHVEDGVVEHTPSWRGDLHLLFLSMGQATLLRDIATSVAGYEIATGTSRWIDNAMANKSLPLRHGIRTRS